VHIGLQFNAQFDLDQRLENVLVDRIWLSDGQDQFLSFLNPSEVLTGNHSQVGGSAYFDLSPQHSMNWALGMSVSVTFNGPGQIIFMGAGAGFEVGF
jgi:hypothetical protein